MGEVANCDDFWPTPSEQHAVPSVVKDWFGPAPKEKKDITHSRFVKVTCSSEDCSAKEVISLMFTRAMSFRHVRHIDSITVVPIKNSNEEFLVQVQSRQGSFLNPLKHIINLQMAKGFCLSISPECK